MRNGISIRRIFFWSLIKLMWKYHSVALRSWDACGGWGRGVMVALPAVSVGVGTEINHTAPPRGQFDV